MRHVDDRKANLARTQDRLTYAVLVKLDGGGPRGGGGAALRLTGAISSDITLTTW